MVDQPSDESDGSLFFRRLLAWDEYEKLHIMRGVIPPSLLRELVDKPRKDQVRGIPSAEFTGSLVRWINTVPVALLPSVAQMDEALKHQAPNVVGAWNALSVGGFLAEMVERLALTEKMCRDHLGLEPLAFTSLGAARRDEQNAESMRATAEAARESASSARAAADQAARSAKTARRMQLFAIVFSGLAALGTVTNALVNWLRAPL